MKRLTFPNPFLHEHPPVQNINEILDEQKGQPIQDVGLIGEYNFRTHRLDAGTDPNGWYEEDM